MKPVELTIPENPGASGAFLSRLEAFRNEPILDGIRGFAVLLVMLGHFDIPGFKGGAYGVEVFFVLSGYLITRVLLKESGEGHNLGRFYWKRFFRLAPALILMVTGILAAAWSLGFLKQALLDALASLTYISNWTRAIPAGVPIFLGHTWSLSIEEQFYLLWPPLLMLLFRGAKERTQFWSLTALLLLSWIWPAFLSLHGASYARVYNGFDTRAGGLMIGAAFGFLRERRPADFLAMARALRRVQVPSLLGLLAVTASSDWMFYFAPVVWLFTLSVIGESAAEGGSRLGNIFSRKALVQTGKISYGLYLWHYPIAVILLAHLKITGLNRVLAGVPLTFVLAGFSYTVLEKPVMRLRDRPSTSFRRRAGYGVLALTVAAIAAGIAFFYGAEIRNRNDLSPPLITGYGPTHAKHGEGFNMQPSGDSTVWITLSRFPRDPLLVRMDGVELATVSQGRTVTATIPKLLLENLGHHQLTLEFPDRTRLGDPLPLDVE